MLADTPLTGTGDVLEPSDGIMGVGSGGHYALAAARALATVEDLEARDIATRAMAVAADMCVYTNTNFIVEELDEVVLAPPLEARRREGHVREDAEAQRRGPVDADERVGPVDLVELGVHVRGGDDAPRRRDGYLLVVELEGCGC